MNPDGTPIVPPVTPPADPPADATPAWAQAIIDQNADLTSRLESFEEKLTPPDPDPVTPPAPEHPEPWKPQSWGDVDARVEEKARAQAEALIAERDNAARTEAEQAANAAAEVDKYLDSQVDELTKDAKLPAVTNENDPNDPGKLAQRELYGFALSLGTADLKTSYNTLDALHKAGKAFDFVKMELVDKNPALAGKDSAVGSSSAGASGATPTRPDYKTLSSMSLDALAARFGPQ